MATEIERKFLLRDESWRGEADAGTPIVQGYLVAGPDLSVRVRVAGDEAWLTVKGGSRGAVREEFEYPVPPGEARQMLNDLCLRPLIEKTRYRVRHAGREWEIDEFQGDNAGLVVAEVELEDEQAAVSLPPWVGREVTGDPRYLNANLLRAPWRTWGQDEDRGR